MSWERDPRSGALLHKPDRRSEHVVPAWAIAGVREMMRFGHTAEELRPYGLTPPIAGGYDAHPNFAYSTVLTAPSPATTGTSLVVQSGDGAQFASTPFNAVVCPAGQRPTTANAEIVRITNRSTDTLTITRIQESTSARTIVVGDQIFVAPTKKVFTDIETGPGYEWNYTQTTSNITVASTTEGSATTVLSPAAFTPDGAAVIVEFFCALTFLASGAVVYVLLFEGATQITRLGSWSSVSSAYARYKFTPTNASHTYTISSFASAANQTLISGSGGTGGWPPIFVRFTKA